LYFAKVTCAELKRRLEKHETLSSAALSEKLVQQLAAEKTKFHKCYRPLSELICFDRLPELTVQIIERLEEQCKPASSFQQSAKSE